ncbi:hypothetical protein B0T14DRAFT_539108 [Immersiella caudata]|uniref:Uncharacterized protein n=1 Tax=Immersiella caudata TaxID=314043 RepID=A0AA39WLT0_9PEZI|nr:hypothetical protein B0T14DRAFT_539108 [Immersiella caudata]
MHAASHTKDHCRGAQYLSPVKNVCAHFNAFHVYASDPTRWVETNHYCGHLTEDVRQCLLYDSPNPGARLLGVEYMISPNLYSALDKEERQLCHSHVFEPSPLVPQAAWEKAETAEMEEVIHLYGKILLVKPELMTSITAFDQIPDLEQVMGQRDIRFPGADWRRKKEIQAHIEEPEIHPDAGMAWKK